jgi:hypothetical protein
MGLESHSIAVSITTTRRYIMEVPGAATTTSTKRTQNGTLNGPLHVMTYVHLHHGTNPSTIGESTH